MTNALKAICCLIVLSAVGFIWSCGPGNQPGSNNTNGTPAASGEVKPAPFPNPNIPGFNFPEQAAVIDGWVKDGNNAEIYKHGWGIWAGLTTATTQVPPGGTQPLLVFETWLTPDEMIAMINAKPIPRSNRANLSKPHQFLHAAAKDKSFDLSGTQPPAGNTNSSAGNAKPAPGNTTANTGNSNAAPARTRPDFNNAVSVSYSPPASKYAIDNKIFLWDTLKGYGDKGMTDIPAFPSDAITIKPVFKVIEKSELNPAGLFVMPSWPGPIDIVAPFPEPLWKSCIYVDLKNNGKGDGSQDPTCSNATPATTYNLTDFVNYTLNQEDANFYNKEFGLNAAAGDTAVLVGMHVTTREVKKWTWQSFYWAPNPADPKGPSSADIAKARPSQITGAPAHYAMALAYAMVFPVQPDVGGQSVGDTIYGYNPYLEAGFGPGVFTGSNSFVTNSKGVKVQTDAGVRTNCMSCHVYASVTASDPCQSTTPYSGDAYVSLDDPAFKDQLKLDFAWSVQSNIQKNGAPCPTPTPAPATPSPTR
jgi:hypothetical protein